MYVFVSFRARPSNLNIDAIMHVNHMLDPCAMLIVFNPKNEALEDISLDLSFYYAGARDAIRVKHEEEEDYQTLKLEDAFYYTFTFDMPARNLSYWTFECTTATSNEYEYDLATAKKPNGTQHLLYCDLPLSGFEPNYFTYTLPSPQPLGSNPCPSCLVIGNCCYWPWLWW